MTQDVDDEEMRALFAAILRRDESALVRLQALFGRRIFAFAFHRLGDHAQAESVVVETLWEVWNSASRFRGESRVSTWIFGIARFKSLEAARERGQQHEDIEEYSDVLVSDFEDGETRLMRMQQAQQVVGCLGTLSAAHRECMQLVHYEGLGLADVARIQGVPENTVKTRMFHARQKLRTCLEALGGPRKEPA